MEGQIPDIHVGSAMLWVRDWNLLDTSSGKIEGAMSCTCAGEPTPSRDDPKIATHHACLTQL